jgi:hypothetical protein
MLAKQRIRLGAGTDPYVTERKVVGRKLRRKEENKEIKKGGKQEREEQRGRCFKYKCTQDQTRDQDTHKCSGFKDMERGGYGVFE